MQIQVTLVLDTDNELHQAFLTGLMSSKALPTPMLDRAGVTAAIDREVATAQTAKVNKVIQDEELDKPKRHRRTKAEIEAAKAAEAKPVAKKSAKPVEAEVEEPRDDDYDFGAGIAEAETVVEYDIDKHIIPAFHAYSTKHGRPKAGEMLRRFIDDGKPLNVRLIDPSRYGEVMEALT